MTILDMRNRCYSDRDSSDESLSHIDNFIKNGSAKNTKTECLDEIIDYISSGEATSRRWKNG